MENIEAAAAALSGAEALLITAGAGLGVDSGLPDFRGDAGFWRAYPPLRSLGISFVEMANPEWFATDPALAWGFYGHRHRLYAETKPHDGFARLLRWAGSRQSFVFTSNVDGHFQKAGFDGAQVTECHGSLQYLQCTEPCTNRVWRADLRGLEVDEMFRASGTLPICPSCGALARPNVLMFGDGAWVAGRTEAQHQRFAAWLAEARETRCAVLELGAGSAVPTVRRTSEAIARRVGGVLIRVNPRESAGPPGCISVAGTAAQVLRALDWRSVIEATRPGLEMASEAAE